MIQNGQTNILNTGNNCKEVLRRKYHVIPARRYHMIWHERDFFKRVNWRKERKQCKEGRGLVLKPFSEMAYFQLCRDCKPERVIMWLCIWFQGLWGSVATSCSGAHNHCLHDSQRSKRVWRISQRGLCVQPWQQSAIKRQIFLTNHE